MKCVIALSTVAAIAGTAAAGLSPWRQFDAALDTAGDAAWSNTSALQSGQAQNFNFATAQTAVSVNDPIAIGLTAAYEFGTTGQADGGNWSFWGQAGGGRANHAETSYEIFFRVDNLSGNHLIMEIGGAAAGVSMGMQDGQFIWATNPGGAGTDTTHAITTGIGLGWHHAVAVWNRNTLSTSLYLDGQLVGDAALAAGTTGWTGSNEATLGGLNTSAATTMDLLSITEFDGAIAAFNYYNGELSAQEIAGIYNANFIPAPGALALVGAAGLCAARRRRA